MMMDIYDITASSMTAQRLRMDTISANLANVNTTRRSDGKIGAYQRKNVVFAPMLNASQDASSSESMGKESLTLSNDSSSRRSKELHGSQGLGVQVLQISTDTSTPMRMVYDPTHPDANQDGFVEYPNVNAVTEMVDLISASKAYEASVSAFKSTKSMNEATLQM